MLTIQFRLKFSFIVGSFIFSEQIICCFRKSGKMSSTTAVSIRSTRSKLSAEERALIDINENLVIDILRRLPLWDLIAVGSTCHQFRDIAVNTVYRNHSSSFEHISIAEMTNRYMEVPLKKKKSKLPPNLLNGSKFIKRYVQRFGHLIQHIDFDNSIFTPDNLTFSNEIFTCIIANYLRQDNRLKSLNISNFNIDLETLSNGSSMFVNLNKLKVAFNSNWPEILPLCPNLEELCLGWDYARHATLLGANFTFQKLRTLTINVENWNKLMDERLQIVDLTQVAKAQLSLHTNLNRFFINNPGLMSLSLKLPDYFVVALVGQLEYLEELHLEIKRMPHSSLNLQPLFDLTRLRKMELRLFHYSTVAAQFLQQSASAETLEHLSLEEWDIDEAFINGLRRFHNLRHLELTGALAEPINASLDIESVIPEAIWQKLQQLNHLIELHLHKIDYGIVKGFLSHLTGAHHSLQICSILSHSGEIDDEFVTALAHFEHLQTFELCMFINDENGTVNWQPFQRLAQLKELTITPPDESHIAGITLRHLFDNLGSRDTLEKLKIQFGADEDGCVMSIVNFVNLKELELSDIEYLSSDCLSRIGNLGQIKKISVTEATNYDSDDELDYDAAVFSNRYIVDLVHGWPSLESFYFCVHGYKKVCENESDLCDELTSVLKSRNKYCQPDIHIKSYCIRMASKTPFAKFLKFIKPDIDD